MHGQCLLGRHGLRFSGAWLAASSQSLPHPGLRVFHRSWVCYDEELPSAATLSRLQFNISGIIGPALGGLLVPLAGANFVFALKCRLLPLGCGGNSAMETTNPLAKVHQNRSGCPYRSGKQKQDRSNNFRLVLFGVVIFPLPKGVRSNLRLTNTYSRRRRPDCFP